MYKLLTATLAMLFCTSLSASKKGREFVRAHRPPTHIVTLANHIFADKQVYRAMRRSDGAALQELGFTVITAKDNVIMEHKQLPGFIIKFGNRFAGLYSTIARVRMAEKIDRYIQRKNLTAVHVPKKYLYHIPHRRHKLKDQNYLVFSQKMPIQPRGEPRIISKQAIEETCRVINRFAIVDASPGNFGIMDEGNVAIVDTESTIRTGGGLWYILDNPLTRFVQSVVGTYKFRTSVSKS